MITQSGSIKVDFSMSERVQRQFTAKLYVGSVIALIVGILGLIAYIATDVACYMATGSEPLWADAMLLFAAPFGCGLILLLTLRRQYRAAAKPSDRTIQYEFFSDAVLLREARGGMQVGVMRIGYADIVKVKQTESYLFFYPAKTLAYPVEKEALSAEERDTVLALMGQPNGGARLPLPALGESGAKNGGGDPPSSGSGNTDIDGIFELSGGYGGQKKEGEKSSDAPPSER